MNEKIIKDTYEQEYGNTISVSSHFGTVEYEVEGDMYEQPACSSVEIKMNDYLGEELGTISLSNSEAIYLARLILESVTLIND